MIVIIDNYDSFVFNVARAFVELGEAVEVVRNDAIDVAGVRRRAPRGLVLSPGPCTPAEAGMSLALITALSGTLPILGICLGHQCIGQAFGGRVARARRPMHGRASRIRHEAEALFAGLSNPLSAGRYHSLVVEIDAAESPVKATAFSEDGEIMALQHREHPTFGVQFHPESILTPEGSGLFRNFLQITRGR